MLSSSLSAVGCQGCGRAKFLLGFAVQQFIMEFISSGVVIYRALGVYISLSAREAVLKLVMSGMLAIVS